MYFLILVLYFSLSILFFSLFLADGGHGKFLEGFVLNSLCNYFVLCSLSVHCLLNLGTFIEMFMHTFSIIFNQVVLFPDYLCLFVGLLSVYSFFILPFYPFFVLFLMNFDVVLDPFQNHLFVEIFLSFSQRSVRIMLKFNSLPNAVHLKGLESLVESFNFLIAQRLIKFIFLFLHKTLEIVIFLNSCLFDLLSSHPHIVHLPLVLLGELMIGSGLVYLEQTMFFDDPPVFLELPSSVLKCHHLVLGLDFLVLL